MIENFNIADESSFSNQFESSLVKTSNKSFSRFDVQNATNALQLDNNEVLLIENFEGVSIQARSAESLTEAATFTSAADSNHYVADLSQDVAGETGIFPRIVINDAVGPTGSQTYALDFPAVVALPGCTGTLIAPAVVISAAHCGGGAGDSVRFGPDSSSPIFTATTTSVVFPGTPGALLNGSDLSLWFLDADVPSTIAEPMNLTDMTSELEGMLAATVGYGANGVGSTGHGGTSDGLRWGGENIIDVYGTPAGATGTNIISTDFDDGSAAANTIAGSDPTPLVNEATTAPGDSGGPVLVQDTSGEWLIAGVLSGGTTPTSVYGDISWWTGVAPFQTDIEDAGGTFGGGGDPPPPPGDDHSDLTDETATMISFNEIPIARENGFIGTLGDRDVFSFELLSPSKAIFDGVSINGFDPFVRVYDKNGVLLGENDNKETGSFSSQFKLELEAGNYFVSVGATNDESTGSYRVAVRHNGPRDDHGSRFSNATFFAMNAEGSTFVSGTADIGHDIDMFRFVADRTGEVVFRTAALSGDLNTVIRIFDDTRSIVSVNNNWNGSLNSRASWTLEEGRTYYAHVDTVRETTGDYRMVLIPKVDSDGDDRLVDLNLPETGATSSVFARGNLSLQQDVLAGRESTLASTTSPTQTFGPEPLKMVANGLG